MTLSASWIASNEKPALSGPAKSVTAGSVVGAGSSPPAPSGSSSASVPTRAPSPSAFPQGSQGAWSKSGPARLVWTGFKERDGNAEVLLQVTRGREPKVLQEGGRLRLIVPSCQLKRGLAGKPLDTRFFAGAVDAVAAHQRGRNVEVDVRLRHSVSPLNPQRRQGPHGSAVWVVALPAPGSSSPGTASSGSTVTAQSEPNQSREKARAPLRGSASSASSSAPLAVVAPSSGRSGLSHRDR